MPTRPDLKAQVTISRGALAGVEGKVVRELEDGRVLLTIANGRNPSADPIPGAYVAIHPDCLEPSG